MGDPDELFIDVYAVDPNGNGDPLWQNHAWPWDPIVRVSDYWVGSWVKETIDHEPPPPDGGAGAPDRRISPNDQYEFWPVFHGVGRYLFRRDGDGPLWDYYERWQGALDNYMKHPNNRARQGVWQGEPLDRVQNGTWNQP